MDIQKLKDCLNAAGREELGIPIVNQSIGNEVFKITDWTTGTHKQVWFVVANGKELRKQIPPNVRCRILPLSPDSIMPLFKRGPFDSLLIPIHGFLYNDPNLTLDEFWTARGSYKKCEDFVDPGWTLWFWTSNRKPLRFFGLCHHHAVLWDMKQILRPLGIRIDFTWLCDGRPPVNEAIASSEPPFFNSNNLYKTDPRAPLPDSFKERILERGYDAVITSHSIITTYRLKDLGLPLIHVNSTRFGNEWIQDAEKHGFLVQEIQKLLDSGSLTVVHNNRGDQQYFREHFPSVSPQQEVYCPSLCESVHRIRDMGPKLDKQKFLIWDTRQVLLQETGSPFMKNLFHTLTRQFPGLVDSQAILLAEKQAYLPEGFLDDYTAVIHIPYNISTMSIFQQTRANIPVWVPSQKLLAELWADAKEPNELSWTIFKEGSENQPHITSWDKARLPETTQRWASLADFYQKETMGCVLEFDSIEDLQARLRTTDYEEIIDKSEATQKQKREEIFALWEQVTQRL